MRLTPSVILMLALLPAGCREKVASSPRSSEPVVEQQPDANASSVDTSSSTAAAAPAIDSQSSRAARRANQPVVQPAENTAALEGAVHAFMTIQLQKFIQENGRMPKDFSEFANARMDSVPFPPPGMDFVIDYANKQVKVVKSKKK